MITLEDEKCFRINIRKPFLLFFDRWLPLTYRETEYTEEQPIEFRTLADAKEFVNKIAR
jgi:hypothetical protein